MLRSLALLLAAAVLLGACGDETPSSTQLPTSSSAAGLSGPETSLTALLDALRTGDYVATEPYVDETQLALFAAIESGDPDTLVSMVESGVTDAVRENFWSSFVEAIAGLAGAAPEGLELGEAEPVAVGEVQFALVDVEFVESESSGTWVLRETEAGTWVVDVIGTFGSAFVNPLTGWLEVMTPVQRATVGAAVAGYDASWDQLIALQGNDEAGEIVRSTVQEMRRLIAAE